jgi:hypothetical protein
LDPLVLEEYVNRDPEQAGIIARSDFGRATGKLIGELALRLFGFFPESGSRFAPVLHAVLSPAEMLGAAASTVELVTGVFAESPINDAVSDENCDYWSAHVLYLRFSEGW